MGVSTADTIRCAVWLVVTGSKEAIVDGVTDFDHRSDHALAEAFLVVYLLEEGAAANRDDLMAKDLDFQDRT